MEGVKPKTKEEFIKFLDKEIGKMDEKMRETLKIVSYPYGFGGWNYEEALNDYYYVNVKLITPNVKVSPIFLIDNEYVRKRAKEMDIPEEWLKDQDFYEKFKKYLIYEAASDAMPFIKDQVIRLVSYLQKLEEVS